MIVVIGASGLVGRAALQALQTADCECEGASSRAGSGSRKNFLLVDALDPSTWRNLPSKLSAVLIATARPGLVDCRSHPRETRQLNVEAVAALAAECAARGACVVLPSSSCVFDGSRPDFGPEDAVCPACEYGRQKADVERRLPSDAAIVRLTKVMTADNPLLQTWRQSWATGLPVAAAADARMSLLKAGEVGSRLARLLQQPVPGTWQLSADDDVSWSELASVLAVAGAGQVRGLTLRQIDPQTEFTPAFGTFRWAWPFEGDRLSSCTSAVEELAVNFASRTL